MKQLLPSCAATLPAHPESEPRLRLSLPLPTPFPSSAPLLPSPFLPRWFPNNHMLKNFHFYFLISFSRQPCKVGVLSTLQIKTQRRSLSVGASHLTSKRQGPVPNPPFPLDYRPGQWFLHSVCTTLLENTGSWAPPRGRSRVWSLDF